ncbi:large conductance mechanosensitive channel protein MscL [Cuneatibacter caecimuris]|uniref:Large-conductance mechanosensitive channel n=1 Tax=Cuneatibacter caecimuris TaxID=1796618 RepID=A0A4Q7PK64_9FIRM|nr:large conductance mechanosensitive channel protein MscL [Cuneatibacter caecimuris]RZT00658.1 large conductance mechanosensitive channel [Cuneatibacter caecimuris]
MLKEFKKFIMRGNVIDMAVGVIVGGAFNSLVQTLINDVVMPLLGLLTGKIDFSNLFLALDGNHYESLAAAEAAGAAVVKYGSFIGGLIQFLIMAFVVFLVVKGINKLHHEEPAAPATKACPHCQSQISIKATKCPFCTSDLTE